MKQNGSLNEIGNMWYLINVLLKKHVLDSCFLKSKSKVFQQVIGLPSGLDTTLSMANLYFVIRANGYERPNRKNLSKVESLLI